MLFTMYGLSLYLEKCTDCDGFLFIEDLMKCERAIEDLVGFGVFGVVMTICSIFKISLQVSHTGDCSISMR